jgi:hypothetical protein
LSPDSILHRRSATVRTHFAEGCSLPYPRPLPIETQLYLPVLVLTNNGRDHSFGLWTVLSRRIVGTGCAA